MMDLEKLTPLAVDIQLHKRGLFIPFNEGIDFSSKSNAPNLLNVSSYWPVINRSNKS